MKKQFIIGVLITIGLLFIQCKKDSTTNLQNTPTSTKISVTICVTNNHLMEVGNSVNIETVEFYESQNSQNCMAFIHCTIPDGATQSFTLIFPHAGQYYYVGGAISAFSYLNNFPSGYCTVQNNGTTNIIFSGSYH